MDGESYLVGLSGAPEVDAKQSFMGRGTTDCERASKIMLNGVSVARRKRLKPASVDLPQPTLALAASYERSLSVIMTRGGVTADLNSFLMSRCAATVSSTLDRDVENEAILIDRAQKPVLLAGDRDDNLIQMPVVAASRRTLADLIGERFAELLPHWREVS
jgi:hypothetical protein